MVILTLLLQSGEFQNIGTLRAQAQRGDTKAQVRLGTAYASGEGVTFDETEAVK